MYTETGEIIFMGQMSLVYHISKEVSLQVINNLERVQLIRLHIVQIGKIITKKSCKSYFIILKIIIIACGREAITPQISQQNLGNSLKTHSNLSIQILTEWQMVIMLKITLESKIH